MAVRPVVKMTRKEIYDEVWKIAVSGMAMKYSIPYSAMRKQIMDANIPVPPSGYWTKKEYGKDVTVTELEGDPNEVVALYKSSVSATKMRNAVPADEDESTSEQKPVEVESPAEEQEAHLPEQNVEPVALPVLGEPEIQEGWGGTKYNVYRRETLYKEVWQFPVTEVAKKYAVSDVAIHKICKSLDIPTPPRGYWEKLRAGKGVQVIPLPHRDSGEIKTGIRNENLYKQTASEGLAFLSEEDRGMVLAVASQIVLPEQKEKQHPKVAAYRKSLPALV